MADFVEMNNKEENLAIMNSITSGMENGNGQVWLSFDALGSEEAKVTAFNAMSDNGTSVMDCNGQVIELQDVIIMPVEVQGENGTDVCPRTIIIDTGGKVYSATSWGLYRSLQRMNSIFNGLHFEDGKKVQVNVVKTKKGKTINLKLV